MMQPCLIRLHVISLVARGGRSMALTTSDCGGGSIQGEEEGGPQEIDAGAKKRLHFRCLRRNAFIFTAFPRRFPPTAARAFLFPPTAARAFFPLQAESEEKIAKRRKEKEEAEQAADLAAFQAVRPSPGTQTQHTHPGCFVWAGVLTLSSGACRRSRSSTWTAAAESRRRRSARLYRARAHGVEGGRNQRDGMPADETGLHRLFGCAAQRPRPGAELECPRFRQVLRTLRAFGKEVDEENFWKNFTG